MMKTMLTAAALALLALAHPARAQDTTAAPSPARMRAAEELMAAMDMERNYARTVDAMVEQQKTQNAVIAQHEAEFRAFFERYMSWEQIEPEYIRLYAETYTEDELHQLAAFYRTPLGRRLMETLPQVGARSAEITQRRVMVHMPELISQIMGTPPAAPRGTGKKP